MALPRETVTVDIHCVTKWSKFDTVWAGVSLDVLLEQAGVGPAESTGNSRVSYWPGGSRVAVAGSRRRP
jgi:DMSO/TMAO reductase YedYZ molybdopterin-dependent catalytic subunit